MLMQGAEVRLQAPVIWKGKYMGKKRKKSVPVIHKQQEKGLVINMNEINLKKQYIDVSFKTGGFITEKDRPRKKDWKREYERAL